MNIQHALIIDDEPSIQTLLQRRLQREGWRAAVATNGKKGLREFCKQDYALVICDLIMPEMEGLETIREIRKLSPTTKIIAISGGGKITLQNNSTFLAVARHMGADAVLEKPFQATQLGAHLQDLFPGSLREADSEPHSPRPTGLPESGGPREARCH